ncbi:MAG: tetratricopeptide repeat protein, partial [Planctomycetota bacterium]
LWRGRSYLEVEKLLEAEADLDHLIQINPRSADARCFYGDMKRWKGDYDEAIQNYEKAIELSPNYAEAYMKRGTTKRLQKRLEEALLDFNRAIELDPANGQIYLNRAAFWVSKKEWDLALDDCNYVLKNIPASACFAWEMKGVIYEEHEQRDLAIEALEKALLLRPNRFSNQKKYAKLLFKRIIERYRNKQMDLLQKDLESFLKYAPAQHSERENVKKLYEQIREK